jgi:hypothetical protein
LTSGLIAAPAVVTAIALAAIEGGGLFRQDPSLTRPAASATLADAIRHHGVEHAYAFIRAGQDPNAATPFRDRELTGDREVAVTPLVVAVATNRDNAVMMLLGFGARLDHPGNRLVICLADRLGHEAIAKILRSSGQAPPDVSCPATPVSGPPLLAYVQSPDGS